MKKIIFLGLLVVLGLSFAEFTPPTSGVGWNVFKQATCQGVSAMSLAYNVDNIPYEVGESCATPGMPYSISYLCGQVCWESRLYTPYMVMSWECNEHGSTSSECITAKNQFFSAASTARGTFSATKTAHLLFARQALYANRMGWCGTTPQIVSGVLYESIGIYRECLGIMGPEEFFDDLNGFCYSVCPDVPG